MNRVLAACGLSLCTCLFLLPATPAAAQELTELQAEVWRMEETYWERLRSRDIEGYMELWHPDYVGWPRSNAVPIGTTEIRALIERSRLRPERYDLTPRAIRLFGDVAIVHYTYRYASIDAEGAEVESSGRITHTWQRDGGVWRIIGGMSAPEVASAESSSR